MEFVFKTAVLAVGTFAAVAVVAMLATAFSSKPSEAGHLQPRYPLRAQGWSILACVLIVPFIQRWFSRRMGEQEQINSFLVTAAVLSLVWLMLLSRHVRLGAHR